MDTDYRINDFRRRLEQEPRSRVFAPLADLLGQKGQVEEALSLLADGVARHPDYLSARVIQGRLLLKAGRRQEAITVLESVLHHDDQNMLVLELLVDDALATGEQERSAHLLEQLITLDPEHERWPRELACLQVDSRPARAGTVDAAGKGLATMTLVDIYIRQGYFKQALSALRTIADREPDREDVRIKIAELETRDASDRDDLIAVTESPSEAVETNGTSAQAARKAAQRAAEKRRFARWLDSVQPDSDAAGEVEP